MKYAIIAGSHRPQSQSGKVALFIAARLQALCPDSQTYVLDLGKTPLPLWDEGVWNNDPQILDRWTPVSKQLASAEAVVVIAPEWGGMVPAALKNLFLFASDGCLYHKPGLIVGASASRNGAYPVAELRASSYKNTHLQYISEHVIIRAVGDMLNGETPQSEDEAYLRKRLDYSLSVLAEYAKALRQVRDSGVLNRKEFPFGM
jgi:NAD(P)H-dependent FMN reductase